eukprot:TRINITY_DN12610_c0_g2_i2.p1 TRINITY_DN12610_c0_g2~~TRINITY_DN12610_c0_g2_i2.p1  ORF type:complete len:210 (+),score=76.23 TRINITY_DN12610_c0_g2_i2:49-678(+)
MASKKIASSLVRSLTKLDGLIHRLEINTGVAHKASPFAWLTAGQKESEIQANKPAPAPQKQAQNQPTKQAETKEENKKPQEGKKKPQEEKKTAQEKAPAPVKEAAAAKNEESKTAPPPKDSKEEKEKVPPGTLEDYPKMDIRVGRIIECWKHPESDKLWCEKIDIGTEIREIASGLQKFVPQDQMSGLVLVLVNLKPRKLAGKFQKKSF